MRKIVFIIACLASLFSFNTAAQDSSSNGNDVFNENQFDNSVKQDVATDQKNKLEYLPGGTFIFTTNFSSLDDYSAYDAFGRLYGKAFLKVTQPDVGIIFISGIFSSYLFQGTNSSAPQIYGQGHDLFTLDMSLAEFYLSFDIAKTVFVRAGKQLVAWGPSYFWTPGDFINREKNNALEPLDIRTGKPLLKLHVPVGGIMNFFAFADFSNTVTSSPSGFIIGDMVKTTNVAFRMDFTALGFEYGLSGYWGVGEAQKYGADIAGLFFGFDVYSEFGVTIPSDASLTTWGLATGFQRDVGDNKEWSFGAEFFYNSAGVDGAPNPLLLESGNYTPFYIGKYYLYLSASRKKLFNDILSVTALCVANLSDLSLTPMLSCVFEFPKMINFTLDIIYATGGSGKEFTFVYGNNSISVSLTSTLSF